MTFDALVSLSRERLAARRRRVAPRGPLVQAAVLVPLTNTDASLTSNVRCTLPM